MIYVDFIHTLFINSVIHIWFYLCIHLSIHPSTILSIFLFIHLPFYPSIHHWLSVNCLYLYISKINIDKVSVQSKVHNIRTFTFKLSLTVVISLGFFIIKIKLLLTNIFCDILKNNFWTTLFGPWILKMSFVELRNSRQRMQANAEVDPMRTS